MRLMCTSCIINNGLGGSVNQKRKLIKSTLALCKQPNSEEYCLLLFSVHHKNGLKYRIKDNLCKVHTRFVCEGKITLQFKDPDHSVQVQADTIPLKGFLHLLKQVVSNKVVKGAPISSISVTPMNPSAAPKKLVILKRSDYPSKGFPRTLEILHINEVRSCSVHCGIFQLSKLKVLDLSHNLIERVPEELNKLVNLAELNLSDNRMGASAPKQWNWMRGTVSKSLKTLNLSNNNLKYLPSQIMKLQGLVSLHLDKNELQTLPSCIGSLRNLQYLTAAHNRLVSLPGSARKLRLAELDLSDNRFDECDQHVPWPIHPKPTPVRSLREYAARKVLHARMPYDTTSLPASLIDYLEFGKYCVCGRPCFEHFIKHSQTLYLMSISKNYVSTSGLIFVPADCFFCSAVCFRSTNFSRLRHPII